MEPSHIRHQDLVIRASTIWDTRAPFHYFFMAHRRFSQTHAVMTMALESLAGKDFRALNRTKLRDKLTASPRASLAWSWWTKSFLPSIRNKGGPTGNELAGAVRPMERTLRHALLASYISAFDHYVVCWALNYLLARLENKEEWTASERWLAHELSPVGHGDCDCKMKKKWNRGHNPYGVRFPETSKILQVVGIQSKLRNEPAVKGNTRDNPTLTAPVDAWTALEYWRQFRNHIVHKGTLGTRGLAAHTDVWGELVHAAAATSEIRGGQPLPAPDYLLPACFGTHYRVAIWLQEFLISISHERRGHFYSPGPRKAKPVEITVGAAKPKPLLIDGDHQASLNWVASHAISLRSVH